MIVKDEEEVLARCLESVKEAVDEIIIVDTGSTDGTKSIAAQYTDKIYDFEWINDFSAARNESFSKASMDYQMWLDADDVVPPESVENILALKETLDSSVDMVEMNYVMHTEEDSIPYVTLIRERLFKRINAYKWEEPIHERIFSRDNIYYVDIEIWHFRKSFKKSFERNINFYKTLETEGKILSPHLIYCLACEYYEVGEWIKATYYFEKLINSVTDWNNVYAVFACFYLSFCYINLNEIEKVLPVLFKSFSFGAPCPEICSEIGRFFKCEKDFRTALSWYDFSARIKKAPSMELALMDYWGYIPNLECCECCCELGDWENAWRYNELANSFKPGQLEVEENRKRIESKIA
jgi:glycosyltransferase involved in cell wall biosynthesis